LEGAASWMKKTEGAGGVEQMVQETACGAVDRGRQLRREEGGGRGGGLDVRKVGIEEGRGGTDRVGEREERSAVGGPHEARARGASAVVRAERRQTHIFSPLGTF
jgi:hypothetical protein